MFYVYGHHMHQHLKHLLQALHELAWQHDKVRSNFRSVCIPHSRRAAGLAKVG